MLTDGPSGPLHEARHDLPSPRHWPRSHQQSDSCLGGFWFLVPKEEGP